MTIKKSGTPDRTQIPSLNGLRAISIAIVIFGHLNLKNFGNFALPFPFSILLSGSFGVNVFFVISGFLITTLLLREEAKYGTVNLKKFYVRRMFRIFPAYYFLLLIYCILQLLSVLYFTRTSWLSSIFYYKYLAGGDWESGHFWSLSVEEHFYLVWPLVFLLMPRKRVYFAFITIIIVMFFRYNAYTAIFPNPVFSLNVSIFQRVDAIMIGCLLALYKDSITTWLNKRFTLPGLLFLLLIVFLNSSYIITWNMAYNLHLGFIIIPLGLGSPIGLITNLLIGVLLLLSISTKNIWFRILNHPVLNFIGTLSYSLYLWQQMFFSPKLGDFSYFPLNLFCIIACALFSYRFIEQPFLRVKKRYEVPDVTEKLYPV